MQIHLCAFYSVYLCCGRRAENALKRWQPKARDRVQVLPYHKAVSAEQQRQNLLVCPAMPQKPMDSWKTLLLFAMLKLPESPSNNAAVHQAILYLVPADSQVFSGCGETRQQSVPKSDALASMGMHESYSALGSPCMSCSPCVHCFDWTRACERSLSGTANPHTPIGCL